MTSVIAVNVFDVLLDAFGRVDQIGIGIRVASANTFLRSFGVTVIGIRSMSNRSFRGFPMCASASLKSN